jgi:NAD(P)-dependent dehydrogenase (short-subunit alcohol dehydrogenase family)
MTTLAAGVDWRTVSLPGIDSQTVAVVLGAGGAIGGATARALAAMGASVAVATRDLDRSKALAAEIGAGLEPAQQVLPVVADLAVEGSLAAMATEVVDRMGAPTVLVNSAAIGSPHADVTEVARRDVSALFEVNVVGAYEAVQAVAPAMRAAGYGRIVNVASVAGLRAMRGGVAYGVTKGAVITLTEQLAVELSGDGITVNSVSPGQTPTKLRSIDEPAGKPQEPAAGSNTAIPLGRRGLLDDYVGAIVFLSSGLAGYVTGVDIPVEGGIRLVRAKSF